MNYDIRQAGFTACLALAGITASAGASVEPPERALVLDRLARVAELYRDNALSFTCDETIHHTARVGASIHRFSYVYRHADDGGGLDDYRTPRGKAHRRHDEASGRADLGELGLPLLLLRAYSWAFVFAEEVRPYYRFAVEGQDRATGRPALRLRFEALPPFREGLNEWNGRAWIDRRSFQLLRVEAVKAEQRPQQVLFEQTMQRQRIEPDSQREISFTTYRTDFDVVKNGMRFPGRVLIERVSHRITGDVRGRPRDRPLTLFRVIQVYRGYRFFGVRTATEIESFVTGER